MKKLKTYLKNQIKQCYKNIKEIKKYNDGDKLDDLIIFNNYKDINNIKKQLKEICFIRKNLSKIIGHPMFIKHKKLLNIEGAIIMTYEYMKITKDI